MNSTLDLAFSLFFGAIFSIVFAKMMYVLGDPLSGEHHLILCFMLALAFRTYVFKD